MRLRAYGLALVAAILIAPAALGAPADFCTRKPEHAKCQIPAATPSAVTASVEPAPTATPTAVPTASPTAAPTPSPTPTPASTPAPTSTAAVASPSPPPSSLTCADSTGIERKFPCAPIPLGPLASPLAEFSRGMHLENFSGVLLDGRAVVRNLNRSDQGDGHSTWGTGRDLANGSTSCIAFDWRYDALAQTGRNLVAQLQMSGSPIYAVSTLSGNWQLVDRVNGVESRKTLGPIQWAKYAYFVVCAKLADVGGYVKAWWSHTAWPDVTAVPAFEKSGDTWQGETGHHTLGQYSGHSSPGVYEGFFSRFGRAATALRAVEFAR